MPVPKRKTSKRRRDQRSSGKGIKPKAFSGCLTCSAPIGAHQVCKECGYYKGVKILQTKNDRMHKRAQLANVTAQKNAPVPQENVDAEKASE
jgi:large subunit ribosomal protein L32